MSEIVEHPHVVESESATTDHEHNQGGVASVIVPLVIVGVLAVISFLLFGIIATTGATYYKSRLGTNGFGYQYEYDFDYPYYSGGLDGIEGQTW